jgi:hypothetical protein
MIKKYFDFKYLSLLESLLKIDKDLNLIISKISDKDPVAKMLSSLINQDIKTNVNYLKPSDKNDDIKFVNDTQVKRFIDAGQDPFDRATNSAKIGRTVRQILTSNGISVTDQQIEKFVNSYKNAWDKSLKKTQEGISLVSGEEIRNWYLESNYVPGGGQLNNSCMRYESTQEFLNIYTENKESCQLVILVDERNRLLGRALLWKLIDGVNKYDYYLDRVYTRFDSDTEKFADWYKDFIKATDNDFKAHFIGKTSGCKVQLKNWKFKKYPYMDTLSILDYETGILGTYEIENRLKLQYHIQDTGGSPTVPGHEWSEHYQKWLNSSDCVWINDKDDYFLKTDCVRDYKNDWIHKDYAVYSEYYKAYVDSDNSEELEGFGLVDSNDILNVYDSVENGKPNGSRKFLYSKVRGSKYVRVEYKWYDQWINKDFCGYDAYNNINFIKKDDIEEEYKLLYKVTSDEYNNSNDLFSGLIDKIYLFYYYSYGIDDKYTKSPIFQYLYESDEQDRKHLFATKAMLDYLNLESDGRSIVYMKNNDYCKGYHKMCYQYTVESLKIWSENIKGCSIETLLKELEEINNFLYSNSVGDYRSINDSYNAMKKHDSYTKYFNHTLSELYKDYDVYENILNDETIEELSRYFKDSQRLQESESIDYRDSNLKEKLKNFVSKYKDLILYFSYWYIVFNDEDYANYRISSYIDKNNIDISNSISSLITYFCRYTDVGDKYAQSINTIRREVNNKGLSQNFIKENNINRYDDEYEKSIKLYNDFLTFLK